MTRTPVQPRAERRRASLLDATSALLQREGFAAVTTNAVAREAGAAVGTVYDYFPNKDALLVALLERYRARLGEAVFLALADPTADLEVLVEGTVRAFARFYVDEPGYAELWVGAQLVGPLRDAGEAWGTEFADPLSALLVARAEVPAERAPAMALTLVHAVSAVVTLATARGEPERGPLVDEAVRMALAYVRPPR